jgi:hypothetical protein
MTRKRKSAEPEPRCPFCGCPELGSYGRQTSGGFAFFTSCNACGKIVPDERKPTEPAPVAPTAETPRAPGAATMPSVEQLVDAQNAINASVSSVLRLTAVQILTISSALGVATGLAREPRRPSPAQLGWAAIIDAGLMARGSPGLRESRRALERVDLATLEAMAALVLRETTLAHPAPEAPPRAAACWHCLAVLEPEPPPHCERCPAYGDCDVEGCESPGCVADAERAAAALERSKGGIA